MTHKTYLAGGVCFRLASDEPVGDSDFFPLFRAADSALPDYTVRILRRPLPPAAGDAVFRSDHRSRFMRDGQTYDFTYFPDAPQRAPVPYACAERHGGHILLSVDYNAPFWDTMIFDAVCIPDLFLEKGTAVVHASFIGVGEAGVLFAGPKQQGKSTQARLWETYRHAVVINGDRAAVREGPSGFSAYGVPFAGSSRVCRNESRPVSAIVFPEKGAENTVAPLSAFEAFKRLIGCLSYTQADAVAQEKAVKLAERMAAECRCLLLTCRPDEGAVSALTSTLGI